MKSEQKMIVDSFCRQLLNKYVFKHFEKIFSRKPAYSSNKSAIQLYALINV